MSMQLSQQAAECLGQNELVVITERVDDVALLIGQRVKMGLPEVLDRHLPRHGTQRRIRWGWTAVLWLASGGLVQCGQSTDDPTRPQIKVMLGSLDPWGRPLATAVLSGARADDGLYIPIMERLRTGLRTTGLLFVDDGKLSALDTRASLARHQDWYVSPLPLTGATAEAMDAWSTAGVTKGVADE